MKYVSPQTEKRKQQQKKRKKQMLIIALAAVLVVAIIAVVFVIGGKNKNKGDEVNTGNDTNVQTEITSKPEEVQPTDEPQSTEDVQPSEEPPQEDTKDTVDEADKADESDKADKPVKSDKKKKNKVSLFAKIKSLFTKTEAMEYKFPAMAFGRSIDQAAESIISLSPLATEFILSSPSQNALVAVSNYCNKYGFEQLMTVGTPLLPNIEKIIQIAPDYVIVQTPLSDVDKIKLEQSGITVLKLNSPESIDDIKEIYRSVTALTHGSEIATFDAQRFADSIQQKLQLYKKALDNTDKKDVVMVFNSYGMVATKDTFEADILANFFDITISGKDYYNEDFASVAASNPQVIIASEYMTETDLVNMGFGDSEAFANGNIYFVNIQQFESYSPKAIDTLCGIANSVYGDAITVQISDEIS